MKLFDRDLVRRRRRRAAPGFAAHDFLKREVADLLAERLAVMARRFPLAVDIGAHRGTLSGDQQARAGIDRLYLADQVGEMAPDLVADEEALPFGEGRLDLVISALSLHWANDLPGTLRQIFRSLRGEGLFIGVMFGRGTLGELRESLTLAESEIRSGLSPRISPFIDAVDGAPLLQRAGFASAVADKERIEVTYADPIALMQELRGMGETNALIERSRRPLTRALLGRAIEIYRDRFGTADGRVTATFEIVTLTGWTGITTTT